jgi:amidophosphoribosyltransferase
VLGIFGDTDVWDEAVNGLFQMQHRGQDACGLILGDGTRLRLHKGLGHVRDVLAARPADEFVGNVACGHVRYPTQGGNRMTNTQPHLIQTLEGSVLGLASNGDITNYWEVREELAREGVEFLGTNDGELILRYIAWQHLRRGLDVLSAIRAMQTRLRGAFSTVLVTPTRMWAIRDPFAFRPLSIGTRDGLWVAASETSALDICRVELIGDLEPGEVVEFGPEGMTRHRHPEVVALRNGRAQAAHCAFEHVYFSRPDSISFGMRVYDVRKRIGAWLADGETTTADVVIPVPDSSNAVALGFAQASGLPFEFGLIRNHYVGRTFISPTQARRDDGVRQKFNPMRSVLEGRRVMLVDDSIVRGTTLRKIVRMVRGAGAAEVHVRIGSPVTRFSCFYGVDTPDASALIANQLDHDGITAHLEADSLRYMTAAGLRECLGDTGNFCMACFDGAYPVEITEAKRS